MRTFTKGYAKTHKNRFNYNYNEKNSNKIFNLTWRLLLFYQFVKHGEQNKQLLYFANHDDVMDGVTRLSSQYFLQLHKSVGVNELDNIMQSVCWASGEVLFTNTML